MNHSEAGADAKLARTLSGMHFNDLHRDPVKILKAETANLGADTEQEIDDAITQAIERAAREGLYVLGRKRATSLLRTYRDLRRIKVGNDPPAEVEPYFVLIKPGAKPYCTNLRRYATAQRELLTSSIRALKSVGAVKKNHKWASLALAVPKPGRTLLFHGKSLKS